MKEILNRPVEWEYGNADIVTEYQINHDIKKTAKIFGLTTAEVRKIVQKEK